MQTESCFAFLNQTTNSICAFIFMQFAAVAQFQKTAYVE